MTRLVPPALYFLLNSGSLDIPWARPGVILSTERCRQECTEHCNVVLSTVLSIVLSTVLNNSFRYKSGSSGRNTRGDKNLSTTLVDRSVDYDNLSTR